MILDVDRAASALAACLTLGGGGGRGFWGGGGLSGVEVLKCQRQGDPYEGTTPLWRASAGMQVVGHSACLTIGTPKISVFLRCPCQATQKRATQKTAAHLDKAFVYFQRGTKTPTTILVVHSNPGFPQSNFMTFLDGSCI